MRILDMLKMVPHWYEAGTSIHLIGPPGCGKSDVTQLFPEILSKKYKEKFGYFEVLVPGIDAPDVRGFLVPTKDPKTGQATSFFTRPPILPSEEYLKEHPRGILVLDERNAGDLLTQKALAPLVLWKRLGEYSLPPGWLIISCSNRIADRAGVIKPPTHLVNRECTIPLTPDVTSWAVWAEQRGMHPMGVAFAKKFPGVVFTDAVPKDDGPFCTPRSFTAALTMLTNMAGKDAKGNFNMELPNDTLTQESVAGNVGAGSSAQMFAFFKLHDQLPDLEDIEKDPSKAKCPQSLDAAYAAAQLCIHYAKSSNVDKLWEYCERLPKEIQTSTAKSLIHSSGGVLLNSKRLSKWIAANRALVVATMG
jgi:energy-coupling factor transporter ATP-binding protein EcfA2